MLTYKIYKRRKSYMITCGIDASSSCTGIGIFNNKKLIFYDKIRPKKDKGFRENTCQIINDVIEILKKYKVEKVYMEDIPQYVKQGSRGKALTRTLCYLGCVQGIFYRIISYENNIPIEYVDVDKWRQEMGFLLGKERKRPQMKQKAIDYVNENFKLNLFFNQESHTIKNDDDIAEAICIVWSQIKPKENDKCVFNRR